MVLLCALLLCSALGHTDGSVAVNASQADSDGAASSAATSPQATWVGFGKQLPTSRLTCTDEEALRSLVNSAPYYPVPGDLFELRIQYAEQRGGLAFDVMQTVMVSSDMTMDIPYLGTVGMEGRDYLSLRRSVVREIIAVTSTSLVSFELAKPATFQVFVGGAVCYPGLVLANTLMRMSDAITLAGGLQNTASYRTVELRRDLEHPCSVDISRFCETGEDCYNPYLRPGDRIHVPHAEVIVNVEGQITSPGSYEILEGETLAHLLAQAGGCLPEADGRRVKVRRVLADGSYTYFYHDLAEAESFDLRNLDIIHVLPQSMNAEFISVSGALFGHPRDGKSPVSIPTAPIERHLPFYFGMTMREILQGLGGYTPYAATSESVIYRAEGNERITFDAAAVLSGTAEDVFLRPQDHVFVPMRRIQAAAEGQVLHPGAYELVSGQTVGDLISISGGFLPAAATAAITLNRRQENGSYIAIQVPEEQLQETVLRSGDAVIVPSGSANAPTISVYGALYGVPRDGLGPVQIPTRSLRSAGLLGETDAAILVTSLDEVPAPIRVQLPYFDGMTMYHVLSALGGPTPYAVTNAGVVYRGEQRVYFDVYELWGDPAAAGSLVLQPGDEVHVPMASQTVTVVGEVVEPGVRAHSPDLVLADYVFLAGGMTAEAGERRIFVVDTSSRRIRNVNLSYVPQPGEIIMVDKSILATVNGYVQYVLPVVSAVATIVSIIFQVAEALAP
ncbi:MAG: SLBB domain-containing protein [Candidatus Eisenbacteria bacterium]|nr:SLBB domain-containing protein [Candidatus Eisenbacteria bacterium]